MGVRAHRSARHPSATRAAQAVPALQSDSRPRSSDAESGRRQGMRNRNRQQRRGGQGQFRDRFMNERDDRFMNERDDRFMNERDDREWHGQGLAAGYGHEGAGQRMGGYGSQGG